MTRTRSKVVKAVSSCTVMRALALGLLLSPQVCGLSFVRPVRMLNLPFVASSTILRAYVPSTTSRGDYTGSQGHPSWFSVGGKRRLPARDVWTRHATRSDPGYSDTSEKVRNNPVRVLTSAYHTPIIEGRHTHATPNMSATIVSSCYCSVLATEEWALLL